MTDIREEDRAMRAAGMKFQIPLEERIQRWEETIGLRVDPNAIALELHRKRLAEQGIEWDDTAVAADPENADELIGGNFMGNPKDPGKGTNKA